MVQITRPTPKKSDSEKHWTTKQAAIFGAAVAAALALAGWLVTWWLATPTYLPSTIFHPRNGSEPQKISDLTSESQTCDQAIRSMLLAFANEIDTPASSDDDAVSKTQSLVDTKLALVPVVCQNLIDPRSVQSARDLEVGVQSVKLVGRLLTATLTITNVGTEPVYLAFESTSYDKNVRVADDQSEAEYRYTKVGGVYNCYSGCSATDAKKFTRVDPEAAASITIQSNSQDYGNYTERKTASLSLALLTAKDGEPAETLSFGFNNMPLDK